VNGLDTRRGTIPFPAYIPVTTFGGAYPLDNLIRPYLPRLAKAIMVSYHYAQALEGAEVDPGMPLLIDSGGFASLFQGARLEPQGHATDLVYQEADGTEKRLTVGEVLNFQEKHADVAFTLDFIIPPAMALEEAKARQAANIGNARWAIENKRSRTLKLYASVQGWDAASYAQAARELADLPFDGFALGGLVPRAQDEKSVLEIVQAVREAIPGRPIHAFGLGKPELVGKVFRAGAQSVDSSSYVKAAVDGISWAGLPVTEAPAPVERLRLAIENLAFATRATLPLAAVR
jgi:helicase